MMHLGTNDVWSNLSPTEILAAYSTMIDWMRESKATIKILASDAQVLTFFNKPHASDTYQDTLLTLKGRWLKSYPCGHPTVHSVTTGSWR